MSDSNLPTETMVCILDGHHGIYLPQVAIKRFDLAVWGLNGSDCADSIESLQAGPEDPDYWDSWDWVVGKAQMNHTDDPSQDHPKASRFLSGKWTWHTGESGDLFAVHESHDWDDDLAEIERRGPGDFRG